MIFRIIALDIDGTLTNSRKNISARTKNKLIAFQKHGGKVVLASGRPTQGIMPYSAALRLNEFGGYIMPFNGGCIINCKTGEQLYRNYLPHSYIPEICRIIKDYPVGINTYKGKRIICGLQLNKYSELEARINFTPIEFDPDFVGNMTEDVPKCLLSGDPAVISELEVILSERFGSELGIFKSEPFFLEIVPKAVDKAQSLDRLLKALDIPTDESIAFGDGFNDITMIRYAGLGVAMNNASDTVKSAADYVTTSNDEDGIADFLAEMGRSVFPSLAML
ncbi:MAG: HAD family phosphatase [Clostridia bacterium]|nr:HAD family phosphatase [Clostridia bacterium]